MSTHIQFCEEISKVFSCYPLLSAAMMHVLIWKCLSNSSETHKPHVFLGANITKNNFSTNFLIWRYVYIYFTLDKVLSNWVFWFIFTNLFLIE